MSGDSRTTRSGGSYPVLLGLIALAWGSSYLFIKIGVETLPPLSLVFMRLLVGLAILGAVVVVTRTPLPRDPRTLGHLAILGAVNIAIPFWLIGWAEQHISSGLTGILQSTSPFFTLVLAASFVHDEHITRGRVAGIAIGFLGILVLSARNLADVGTAAGAQRLLGELAVVLASLGYAAGNTYARRALGRLDRWCSLLARWAGRSRWWSRSRSWSTAGSRSRACPRRGSPSAGWDPSAPGLPT